MIFKYSELATFLEHLKQQAPVLPFREWEGHPAVLLRHDLDLDIEPAFRLAQLEKQQGVRSTFFVMTTSPTYNPASPHNRDRLRQMAADDFEIGLHFDPVIYGEADSEDLQEHAETEARYLSTITGAEVRSISLHNPSVHGQFPFFQDFINAYDPAVFDEERYLADSRMLFSGKDPFAFALQAKDRPVQILLHPLHYSEKGDLYPDIFERYLSRTMLVLDEVFKVNHKVQSLLPGGISNCFELKLRNDNEN